VKISDSDTIKTSEKDLIDAVAGELDWEVIEDLFREKHHLTLEDELEYKDGDIVIHDNQIAYKLNFDIKVKLSVLFDRKGECLGVSTNEKEKDADISGDLEKGGDASDAETNEITDEDEDESLSDLADEVAVMIPDGTVNSDENGCDQKKTGDET